MGLKSGHFKRGFSLMELMVVMVIITILSFVGLPSYRSFQAKARQKEGFNLLTTYFTTAHSIRAEFGIFPGEFVQSGFAPVGTIGYRLEVADNANNTTVNPQDAACFTTLAACNCGGGCATFKTWQEAPLGSAGTIGVSPINPSPCGVPGVTDDTFNAQVAGWISTTAALADKFEMDELKVLTMCQDGLK